MGFEFPSSSPTSIAIQIVLAIVVIIILYIITLVVLNVDTIVLASNSKVKPREMTKIIDGQAGIVALSGKSYNTGVVQAGNFKKIGRSINTAGGAQFTYQFWMKIDDANDTYFADQVILLKGDKRKFNLGFYSQNPSTETYRRVTEMKNQYAIACPMISFLDTYRSFKVRLNTHKHPLVDIDIKMNQNPGSISNQNLLSLLALNNWYLFTFVFQDSFSIPQAAEDGIRFIMYVNETPYVEHNSGTMPELKGNTLKQNEGDLNLFPTNTNSNNFASFGNIAYYNYALTANEVLKVFEKGYPTHSSVPEGNKSDQPPYITAFNKIDIYNA